MDRFSALWRSIFIFTLVILFQGCASDAVSGSRSSSTDHELSNPGALALGTGAIGKEGLPVLPKHRPSGEEDTFFIDETKEKRIGIRLEPVHSRSLSGKLEFSSTVEARTERSGVVTSLVHGVVTRVLADLGECVKAGQILCYISSPDISEAQSNYLNTVAKVQEARAQLQQIKTRLELVKAEVERAKLLNKEGIAALKEVQVAEGKQSSVMSELAAATALETAALSYQASSKAKLASLGLSTISLNDRSISYELPLKSPISGVIVQRAVSPGQSVGLTISGVSSTDPHNNLFTIADLSKVWVMLEVPQAEVSQLKLNTPVEFRTEVAPDKVFHGAITRLGQNFDAVSRTVAVRTEIPNPNLVLKPGMLILAKVMLDGAGRNVLSVPTGALQQIKNENVVFIKLADHTYAKRVVRLGQRTPQYAEVISGLRPGQEVVTEGSFFLKSEAVRATIGTGASE